MLSDQELRELTNWQGKPLTAQQIQDVSRARECPPVAPWASPDPVNLLIDERSGRVGRWRVSDILEDRVHWFRTRGEAEDFVQVLHERRLENPGRYGFGCGVLPPEGRPTPPKKAKKKATEDSTPWRDVTLDD
jgi:hypothetical protein